MEWSVHECILDNPIEVESDDVVKNAEVSNQDDASQNAVDKALLKKQLYCLNLFQLWRTGAFAVRYEASEDDEDFELNHKVLHSLMYFFFKQETELNVQEGEYTPSKDLAVSLWTDFRAYYRDTPFKEAFCGNFIISNENLQDEFEKFSLFIHWYIIQYGESKCTAKNLVEIL